MPDLHILLNSLFTPVWASALWRACWQGGLAIALVWLIVRAWPAMPALLRVWLWRLAYLKLLLAWLLAGALTLAILPALPHWPVVQPTVLQSPAPKTVAQPVPAPLETAANPGATPTVTSAHGKAQPSLSSPAASTPKPAHHWQWSDLLPLLGLLWLLGIAWSLLRLLLAVRHVSRLRRESRSVGDKVLLRLRVEMVKLLGLRKAPMLLAHPTAGPLLLGTFHPVIIVPETMLSGNPADLRLALAHELAHVRRRDILWGWLPALVEILFFFHPLVYLARREYRLAQEIATDAQALHHTNASPKAYGAMLLTGAAHHAAYRPVPVAVGILESYQILHRRLTAMRYLSHSPRQHVLTGILVCALALVGLVPWRLAAADISQIKIPDPPPQPVPNARNIYMKASEALVHSMKAPNGIIYGCEDFNEMAALGIKPGVDALQQWRKPTPTLAFMQEMMHANQPAMELLRQGFAAEYCEVPCRSVNTLFPHYARFRELERAIAADAYTRSCSGDWAGGMEDCLDGLRLGADVPHGGVTVSMYVGIALQDIARRQGWEIVSHLSAPEAGAAVRRLDVIMARHVPLTDILTEGKWSEETFLLELFKQPNWRETIAKNWGLDEKGRLSLKTISPSTLLTNYDRYMDALTEQAKLPYAARGARPALPGDPVTAPQLTTIEMLFFKDSFCISQNTLLLVTLALQAYHAEHGEYPVTLTELVPAYLKAVPDDPFALKAPLCYKCSANGYLLYSIGPDGKDDGGTPCTGGQKSGDKGVTMESTGDIVAGVNRW